MKQVKMFYQPQCPHSIHALKCLKELQSREPYSKVHVELIDELSRPDYADGFDYYYVPTFYVGDKKVHEGHAEASDVENVLKQALE